MKAIDLGKLRIWMILLCAVMGAGDHGAAGGTGDHGASGKTVKSPQTGDDIPWCWPIAFCSGIALAVAETFRCGMKKRRKKR